MIAIIKWSYEMFCRFNSDDFIVFSAWSHRFLQIQVNTRFLFSQMKISFLIEENLVFHRYVYDKIFIELFNLLSVTL